MARKKPDFPSNPKENIKSINNCAIQRILCAQELPFIEMNINRCPAYVMDELQLEFIQSFTLLNSSVK